MSDNPEVWPPAPNAKKSTALEVPNCPSCGRKLLTQTSILCNWCGAKIDDLDYQIRAAQNRQAMDEAERAQVDALAQEEARYGVLGRLRKRAKSDRGSKSGNSPLF